MVKFNDLLAQGKIFQKKPNKLNNMKNSILITCIFALFFTSCGDIPFDTSERGGLMMATDDKTIIIESLAKAYTEGNFDIAKDYFAEDGVHYVNNDEYTNDEIIAGYNFHSLLY